MNRLQSALLHTAPAVIIAAYGALWIALHAGAGRSTVHTLWQSLASPKPYWPCCCVPANRPARSPAS